MGAFSLIVVINLLNRKLEMSFSRKNFAEMSDILDEITQSEMDAEVAGKMDRNEFLQKILEDFTTSDIKEVLTNFGQNYKKNSKRPQLITLVINYPEVTADYLMKFSAKKHKKETKTKSVATPDKEKKLASKNSADKKLENGHCSTSESSPPKKSPKKKKTSENKIMKTVKQSETHLVIWKQPLSTVFYFSFECFTKSKELAAYIWEHKITFVLLTLLAAVVVVLDFKPGPHQAVFQPLKENFNWCFYWTFLGILSSVGLGTGLHTFLLYLGPHIASVTLAAFECNSVNFPSPPYPKEINCPPAAEADTTPMTIWKIISKVRLEAFMWGLGTALGELPPYFMARAARLSGTEDLDAELVEMQELKKLAESNPDKVPFAVRCKLHVQKVIETIGFPGILLMASIPNPLFDLAGITCGYLLVPFWQFFGATAIGKAIVKMHIQKLFVIISFSQDHAKHFVSLIAKLPYIGAKLETPFKEFFDNQKKKLHRSTDSGPVEGSQSWLSIVFDKLVLAMVLYFLVSILNSMAQTGYKRYHEANKKSSKVKAKSQ